jgi:hypothetical protein
MPPRGNRCNKTPCDGILAWAYPLGPTHRQSQTRRLQHGAQGRNRTTDTAIFSRMLYQLSYLGIRRQRARTLGGYRKGIRRSSRTILRGRWIVILVRGRAGHDILIGEPAPEIDLGAARAAERAARGVGGAAADRAACGGMGDRTHRQCRNVSLVAARRVRAPLRSSFGSADDRFQVRPAATQIGTFSQAVSWQTWRSHLA